LIEIEAKLKFISLVDNIGDDEDESTIEKSSEDD